MNNDVRAALREKLLLIDCAAALTERALRLAGVPPENAVLKSQAVILSVVCECMLLVDKDDEKEVVPK